MLQYCRHERRRSEAVLVPETQPEHAIVWTVHVATCRLTEGDVANNDVREGAEASELQKQR